MEATLGTISHGTMRTEDLIPLFVEELERLDEKKEFANILSEAKAIEDFDSEEAADTLDTLFNVLNDFAPSYCYFGSHAGDGSDYGFWVSENIDEDFDGLRVSDLSEVPDDYVGEVLYINDHGNMTLYVAECGNYKEIWGIV